MPKDAMLTVAQVASQLGITRYQVYRRITRGNLPATYAQQGSNHYLIRQSAVDTYIDAGGPLFINPGRTDDDGMLRVPEVAIATGYPAEVIREMCRDGRLPAEKGLGLKGQYRIPREAVDKIRR